MKRALLAVMAILLLSASSCSTTTTVVKWKLVAPEDSLLLDCPIDPPPTSEDYMRSAPKVADGASPDETKLKQELADLQRREGLLHQYLRAQMLTSVTCNVQREELRNWKKKQQEIYKAPAESSSSSK